MHAKSGLRVVLKWKIYRPDSVIAAVIRLNASEDHLGSNTPYHSTGHHFEIQYPIRTVRYGITCIRFRSFPFVRVPRCNLHFCSRVAYRNLLCPRRIDDGI